MTAPRKTFIAVGVALTASVVAILYWPTMQLAYHKSGHAASIRKQSKLRSNKSLGWAWELSTWLRPEGHDPYRETFEKLEWHRRRLHELGFLETREFTSSNRVDFIKLVKAGRETFTKQSEGYWSILPVVDGRGWPLTNGLGVRIEAPSAQMERWRVLVAQCQFTNK
jgi:hypothetical protein